jgi:hypothetical protein
MKRVLAIDPITRGFGFAVLEGPDCLVDWGVKGTNRYSRDRNGWCLRQLADLIALYQPELLLVEDSSANGSRRSERVDRLIQMARDAALERGVKVRAIPRTKLGRAFVHDSQATKYRMALAIAGRFPELARRLPPIRKPWMSEDTRMGIFDAVALALAFYARERLRAPGA